MSKYHKHADRYGDKPAWQNKVNREKCHEGYADVRYEDVWSLDTRLANIIATHLRAFLKAQKGPNGGCPGELALGADVGVGYQKWLNILRKMIYAFEEYQNVDEWKMDKEIEERIDEGMRLFIRWYKYLWI